jgi:hypothetical protein
VLGLLPWAQLAPGVAWSVVLGLGPSPPAATLSPSSCMKSLASQPLTQALVGAARGTAAAAAAAAAQVSSCGCGAAKAAGVAGSA